MQQLDIFEDGRDVMRVNDFVAALMADEQAEALQCHAALQAKFPDHAQLPKMASLLAERAGRSAQPFADLAQACTALQRWQALHEPAAAALLGPGEAAAWRARRLGEFALRAAALPWRAEQPQGFAAAFWLAAHDWPQTLAPARLQPLVAAIDGRKLGRWLARMGDELDEDSAAWFPAWLLIDQPLLAEALGGAERHTHTLPEQAFATMLVLLRLERQGCHHELVAQRRLLKNQHAGLFACYMKTR